ncbi:ubiquitin-conjugating enzyme [Trifolium repens]|nr:ubiquitin-conjugating enzyme [Trifolium repens]
MSRSIQQPPPAPPPSLSDHSFQTPNSRSVYSGSSSHRFIDPDVIEIPPPPTPNPKPSNLLKQKEAIVPDVIDIDNDDDSADLVLVGEKVKKNKGKTIESVHNGYGDHQTMEDFDSIYFPSVIDKSGPSTRVESSNGYTSVSNNVINIDEDGSDHSYDDDVDDFSDLFMDDYMDVDNYTLLQEHFDNANIPPGIEAPVPWLKEYDLGSNKVESSLFYPSFHIPQSDSKNSQVSGFFQPTWPLEPIKPEIQGPTASNSSVQNNIEFVDHLSKLDLPSQLLPQSVSNKKKFDATQSRRRKLKLALGAESSTSNLFLGPSGKRKPYVFGSSTNFSSLGNSEAMKLPHGGEAPHWKLLESAKKAAAVATASLGSHHSNFFGPVDGPFPFPGTDFVNPWLSSSHFNPYPNYTANPGFFNPFVPHHATPEQLFNNPWVHNSARDGNNGTTADSTVVTISDEAREEILKKFQNFKQFDTIDDTSDHYFVRTNSSQTQHSKNWVKRIQDEWKLLEKDLPDTIFVRVYESRIDLLRAVIIGAEGTPYHDGLFFFDVLFPSGFPNVPPQVYYHSGGLRLNPNLYNCGKVCLSLLNTWSGNKNEKWLPGVSTILQVLVSIQGLILNTKPYFNEPGYARLSGSAEGEMRSLRYNEDTFLLSLRTMVYLIRRPPKSFEDFVKGHFCSRAQDILVACKAYMDGAQVGCLVKGGVQDVDQGDKSCSKEFKNSLAAYVDMLVKEFTQVGAKDCDKFLSSSTVSNKPLE